MSGPDDVSVVWLEKAEVREDAAHALGEWARARGLRLRSSAATAPQTPLRIDLSIADRLEKELDRARETIAALDADGAERALARAEALLRDHPELPQAAWLRAEVHRSWAARWSRVEPHDDARAVAAWQDADALDGGRTPGIGEIAFAARAKVAATFSVRGGSHSIASRLDGVELPAAENAIDVAPAEHQLVVTIDGETVLATWVAVAAPAAGSPRPVFAFNVGDDDGVCSTSALGGAKREGQTVSAPNVTCDAWLAATAGEARGSVFVARCHGSECGPLLEWRSKSFEPFVADKPPPQRAAWPAWATWTAVGVGAVAAATITLIATGIFESRPTEQHFTNGGPRTE